MGQAKRRAVETEPTVAVCIATIPPRKKLLTRALASVNSQTRLPDQLIIYLDEKGEGAGPARNHAWKQAETEWIAFLDDDDEFLPDHLQFCMQVARRKRADVVYPWFELVGWPEATPERPDPLATVKNGQLVHPLGVEFGPEQGRHMHKHAFIPATILVKKVWLERVAGYPAPHTEEWWRYGGCEDWALLIRLYDRGARFVHAPKRTWRLHHGEGTAGRPWRDAGNAEET